MTILDNINFFKKDLKWHDKKRGNKKVIINKHDNFNADVGDNIYFINQNDFEILNKTISDYETQINKLENDLKTSKKIHDKNHEDNIYEIKEKHHQELDKIKGIHQQKLEQLQHQHHQELDKLKDEINQLKQSDIETIANIKDNHNQELKEQQQQHQQALDKLNDEIKQLQHQHHQEIKEYQQQHQQALDKQKGLIDEVTQLKAHEFDYAIKYNDLRQAIKNISWIGAIRNKHKGLLKEYPIIPLSDKQTKYLYDVNTSDNKQ